MSEPSFLTLASPFRYEPDKVKGSRFIADVAPVATEEEAESFLAEVRSTFHDARHHCFAWRLGPEGDVTRASDDGEPAGSAGRPILAQLEGHEVTNVCAVVTRYFGGTKLGVGGLMRAYGGAAGMALDRAELRRVVFTTPLSITFPYSFEGKVKGLLVSHDLTPTESDYGETVSLRLSIPSSRVEGFLAELRDRTAGRASWKELS